MKTAKIPLEILERIALIGFGLGLVFISLNGQPGEMGKLRWLGVAAGAVQGLGAGAAWLFFEGYIGQKAQKNSPILKHLLRWLLVLEVGALLLTGRYDFSVDNKRFVVRAYLSSLYLMALVLPVTYYALRRLLPRFRATAWVVAGLGVLLALPYHWLGLSQAYYCSLYPIQGIERPCIFRLELPMSPAQALDWFPGALNRLPAVPGEALLLMGLALLAGLILGLGIYRRFWNRRSALRMGLLVLVLLFQTWTHLSFRSPYTYTPMFDKVQLRAQTWTQHYLFPDQKGAVNEDEHKFRGQEEFYMGFPYETDPEAMRRGLLLYLTSQLTYFVNDFYVFLLANLVFWFAAVISGYRFASRIWDQKVGVFTAIWIACGSGFIYFVGQPMSYLAGYAILIVLIDLFQTWLVDGPRSWGDMVLYGAVLGLGSMIYDIFPLYVFLLGYGLWVKIDWRKLGLLFVLALAMYAGPLLLLKGVLGESLESANMGYAMGLMQNLPRLLQFTPGEWYNLLVSFFDVFWSDLNRAFFVIPVALALLGFAVRQTPFQRRMLFLLLIPSFLSIAYLHFSLVEWVGVELANLPRLSFVSYPAIFISAAVAITRIEAWVTRIRFQKIAWMVPALVFMSVVLINNIDVLGFPALYYHFYWPVGGYAISYMP